MADSKLTQAQMKNLATTVREEDLQELEDLRGVLQEKADKAREDGRIFMMQEYIRLIAAVSPQIRRIRARFDREALADFRKMHKLMKDTARAAKDIEESA